MKNTLFFLKVPPPVHGSTLMNQKVMESEYIRSKLSTVYFPVSISKSVEDIGRLSYAKISQLFQDYIRLISTLNSSKPKLVYFAVSPFGKAFIKDFFFYLILKTRRIPVVFHHHGKGVKNQGDKSRLFRRLYKYMYGNNYHICLSKELISDISSYTRTTPYVIPNGVKDHQKVKAQNSDSEKVKILYISNYTISKGILDVLDAIQELVTKNTNFIVSIIGKSYDIGHEELSSYIRDKGITNHIEILGSKYGDEKFTIISQHDFLVFPTFYKNECLPLVLIEAMQCGLPVISTFEGGIPSVVDDNQNGFLVESQDVQALTERMLELITNPSMRKQMGARARKKFIENYTIRKFEENVVSVIESIQEEIKD